MTEIGPCSDGVINNYFGKDSQLFDFNCSNSLKTNFKTWIWLAVHLIEIYLLLLGLHITR